MSIETEQWRKVEAIEFEHAQRIAPYRDEKVIEEMTAEMTNKGHRIFQLYRAAAEDTAHVAHLMKFFDFPTASVVMDIGCGIGEFARLANEVRDDIAIVLQNVSAHQLSKCRDKACKIQSDMHDIPVSDGDLGGALVCYSLGHSHLELFAQELGRIIEPGGVVGIFDIFTTNYSPKMTANLGYVAYAPFRVVAEMALAGFELADRDDDFYLLPGIADELPVETLENIIPMALRFIKVAA